MAGASFKMDMGKALEWAGQEINRDMHHRQLAEEIGEMLVSSTQQRFEDEQAPNGSKWEPSQRAQDTGGKTLTDTAELKNSIGYIASPSGVSIGSNKVYAAIHQLGGTIKAKNGKLKFKLPNGGFAQVDKVDIPQREYLGISEEDKEEAQEIIRNFMLKTLSR